MFITRVALFFSALVAAAFPAFSQTYPTRPITMIVPFAVGGPTDTIARIMAERMGKTLGQQVLEHVELHGRHRPHRHARDR